MQKNWIRERIRYIYFTRLYLTINYCRAILTSMLEVTEKQLQRLIHRFLRKIEEKSNLEANWGNMPLFSLPFMYDARSKVKICLRFSSVKFGLLPFICKPILNEQAHLKNELCSECEISHTNMIAEKYFFSNKGVLNLRNIH